MFVSPTAALVFLRQGLLLSLGFAGWLERLSSKPLGFLCTMIIGTGYHAWLFTWILGIRTQAPVLAQQALYQQIVSLAPGSAYHMSEILVLWLVLPDQVQHD